MNISLRFFDLDSDERIATINGTHHVPRKGDEVRLAGPSFYRVVKVLWVYDDTYPDVASIGVIKIG